MSTFQTGILHGLVGLTYDNGASEAANTGEGGQFQYLTGQNVSFSVGRLSIGQAPGSEHLSMLDILPVQGKNITPGMVNRARLLYSLTPIIDMGVIRITAKEVDAISRYMSQINLDAHDLAELDAPLQSICSALQTVPKSVPHIRNHLRRALAGITVRRDIQIPVRDGNYVLADLYLPISHGAKKYPALVSLTIYGKRVVYSGPDLDNPDEVAAFENAEDRFHTTTADALLEIPHSSPWFKTWTRQRGYENIATFNSFYWVPRGYAMVKIDPRGVSQTPGVRGVGITLPGHETNDYFDAIEWVEKQSWCTGNVALAGNSYGANSQWAVAALKPKGLKALVPYAGDQDMYREVAWVGGISTLGYLARWYAGTRAASPRWSDTGDVVELLTKHPFYDSFWEDRQLPLEEIDIPCLVASSQQLFMHARGAFEAFRRIGSKHKHLQIVDGNYFAWPNHTIASKIVLFLDQHLKERESQEELERVGMQMRIGNGEWYWRTEKDWIVPETSYVEWHLRADGTLAAEKDHLSNTELSYSADLKEPSSGHAGVSFVSAQYKEDVEIAGHITATFSISSSSHDADIVTSVWALDENNEAVRYCTTNIPQPMAFGLLRASHRKLDPKLGLPERPWHTHLEADYQPLQPKQICEIVVEINPVTARIRKGWRLRVDITPSEEQPNIKNFTPLEVRRWDDSYHKGATNSVHIGRDYNNFLRIPVVPLKDGPLGILWPDISLP